MTLLIAASTQTLSVNEVLDQVLGHLVESLGATHGLVRIAEGQGNSAQLMARASVGFSQAFLQEHGQVPASDPWMKRVMEKQCLFLRIEDEHDPTARQRMAESGMTEIVALTLPGKEGPLGIIVVGSTQHLKFQADEISYLGNVANLLGLTLQNVRLFEQVATVQQQWAYTFDSIGDPILVHDREFRILRSNQRLSHLLGREGSALVGRAVDRFAGAEKRATTKAAPTAKESPEKATRPIRGCRDIFWRRIRRLRIRRGGNWAPCTC